MRADGGDTAHAHRSRTAQPRTPRLLAVCAVLLGLFFMHGAPASASEGCHGVLMGSAPMSGAHMSMARTSVDASVDAPADAAARPAPRVGSQTTATSTSTVIGAKAGAGGTCWATAVRGRAPLTGWAQDAIAVLPLLGTGLAARGPTRCRDRRRAPPPGGRSLLLRVCVART